MTIKPSDIKNKIKRSEVNRKLQDAKVKDKKERRKRNIEAASLGETLPEKKPQRTLDNTREDEETYVTPDDFEVQADDAGDEFARFFSNDAVPKIMITSQPHPSKKLYPFIGDLMQLLPNAFYYDRKNTTVKQLCQWAINKNFTHLFVLSENLKKCNGLLVTVFPNGPTALFKVSNVVVSSDVYNSGQMTAHQPELILNNFRTRLGHRVGRFLGSLFPHAPDFVGRRVVTFHNQRDFIFVRHHRYVFEGHQIEASGKFPEKKIGANHKRKGRDGSDDEELDAEAEKMIQAPRTEVVTLEGKKGAATQTRIQELGPRFTLKLKWLQEGTFDTQFGEYEWFHKRSQMDTSRRKFHL